MSFLEYDPPATLSSVGVPSDVSTHQPRSSIGLPPPPYAITQEHPSVFSLEGLSIARLTESSRPLSLFEALQPRPDPELDFSRTLLGRYRDSSLEADFLRFYYRPNLAPIRFAGGLVVFLCFLLVLITVLIPKLHERDGGGVRLWYWEVGLRVAQLISVTIAETIVTVVGFRSLCSSNQKMVVVGNIVDITISSLVGIYCVFDGLDGGYVLSGNSTTFLVSIFATFAFIRLRFFPTILLLFLGGLSSFTIGYISVGIENDWTITLPSSASFGSVFLGFLHLCIFSIIGLLLAYENENVVRRLFLSELSWGRSVCVFEEETNRQIKLIQNLVPLDLIESSTNGTKLKFEGRFIRKFQRIVILGNSIIGFKSISKFCQHQCQQKKIESQKKKIIKQKLCSKLIFKLLNQLFSSFDVILHHCNLEKIMTEMDKYQSFAIKFHYLNHNNNKNNKNSNTKNELLKKNRLIEDCIAGVKAALSMMESFHAISEKLCLDEGLKSVEEEEEEEEEEELDSTSVILFSLIENLSIRTSVVIDNLTVFAFGGNDERETKDKKENQKFFRPLTFDVYGPGRREAAFLLDSSIVEEGDNEDGMDCLLVNLPVRNLIQSSSSFECVKVNVEERRRRRRRRENMEMEEEELELELEDYDYENEIFPNIEREVFRVIPPSSFRSVTRKDVRSNDNPSLIILHSSSSSRNRNPPISMKYCSNTILKEEDEEEDHMNDNFSRQQALIFRGWRWGLRQLFCFGNLKETVQIHEGAKRIEKKLSYFAFSTTAVLSIYMTIAYISSLFHRATVTNGIIPLFVSLSILALLIVVVCLLGVFISSIRETVVSLQILAWSLSHFFYFLLFVSTWVLDFRGEVAFFGISLGSWITLSVPISTLLFPSVPYLLRVALSPLGVCYFVAKLILTDTSLDSSFVDIISMVLIMNVGMWFYHHACFQSVLKLMQITEESQALAQQRLKSKALLRSILPETFLWPERSGDSRFARFIEEPKQLEEFYGAVMCCRICGLDDDSFLRPLEAMIQAFDARTLGRHYIAKVRSSSTRCICVSWKDDRIEEDKAFRDACMRLLMIAEGLREDFNRLRELSVVPQQSFAKIGLSCGEFYGGLVGKFRWSFAAFGCVVSEAGEIARTAFPGTIQTSDEFARVVGEDQTPPSPLVPLDSSFPAVDRLRNDASSCLGESDEFGAELRC